MDEQEERQERVRQLEMELSVVRARLKSEQAERLKLWPRAELADTCIALVKRTRGALQRHRKNLVASELITVDLLLTDIARVLVLIDCPDERVIYQNQPCFACGAEAGALESPGGRSLRCNSCGYAG